MNHCSQLAYVMPNPAWLKTEIMNEIELVPFLRRLRPGLIDMRAVDRRNTCPTTLLVFPVLASDQSSTGLSSSICDCLSHDNCHPAPYNLSGSYATD